MIRLKYIVPRIVILALAFIAVWLSKDVLARREVIRLAQRLTGAKVEIGHLQANLQNQRLFLKDLKIADPRNPMSNLLQADLVYLKVDREQLWHRRFVVTEGQINGLVVNSPRTDSGALVNGQPESQSRLTISSFDSNRSFDFSLDDATWQKETEKLGQQLLNKVTPDTHFSDLNLKAESLCRETNSRWLTRTEEWKTRVAAFRQRFGELTATIQKDYQFPNPLRDKAKHEAALRELAQLHVESAELHDGLKSDWANLVNDKLQIQAASAHDTQQLTLQQPGNQFDEQLVSELLLHQENRQLVAEVVAWLVWFRNAVPQMEETEAAKQILPYGEDVCIGAQDLNPTFLIKKIELEGSGWFAQHHFSFVGSAYNLTPTPSQATGATRFELRALGRNNVLIDCEVDRTGPNEIDRMRIQFPELDIAQSQAGHEQSMQVSWGPNRLANADLTLEIHGDRITGEVVVRHSNVSMHVDLLNDLLGGNVIRLRINQGLSQIDQFKTTLLIDGTLDDYSIKLSSDLGTQFSKIVDSAVVDRISQQNQKVLQQVSQVTAQAMDRFEAEFEPILKQQLDHLSQDILRIADLNDTISPLEKEGWRTLR